MNSLKRKVDFLIIGTQKGGTSALDHYLRQHPHICMGKEKELHFFDNDAFFSNTPVDYSIFENQFVFSDTTIIAGESTPIYMYWKPCLERIYNYNKHIKLIIILRNPIQRAYSHWNMEVRRNAETESFSYCIKNEAARLQQVYPMQHRVYSYIDRGFYSHQIEQLLRYFPASQLCFIKYEDFKKRQEKTLHTIFDFLEVDCKSYQFQPMEINKQPYTSAITIEEEAFLFQIYKDDMEKVETLLGWDCSDWKLLKKAEKFKSQFI